MAQTPKGLKQQKRITHTVSLSEPSATIIKPPGKWLNLDFKELWEFRELLYFLIWGNLKVRYKQTVVGVAWVLLQPLLTMAVFSIVFGKLAKLPSEGLPYPLFYYTGLLPWLYFASSAQSATNVMIENQRLITKVYFPRILLPLSAILSNGVDFLVSSLFLFFLMFFYGVSLHWRVFLLPVFALLAVAMAFGVGLWLSALNALYRDVRYAVPFLLQMWLFASPVAYSASLIPTKWQWLYSINPMAFVVEGFRFCINSSKPPFHLFPMLSVSFILLLILSGLFYFQQVEKVIADRI
jgi:lipopolysaccharide transport system permease protein